MEQSLDERVVTHLREARGRKHGLLWTPGSNPITVVVEALDDFLSELPGNRTFSQAEAMLKRAADILLAEEPRIAELDVAEALDDVGFRIQQRLARESLTLKRRDEVGWVFILEVMLRLATSGALTPPACATLLLWAHTLDEILVQDQWLFRYPLRSMILSRLASVAAFVTDEVRHTDLLVSFKYSLRDLLDENWVLPGVSVHRLRELCHTLEERIQQTHDGEGNGPCPDGRPVHPKRRAGRIFQLGELTATEPYLSLPALKGQVLGMLGQLLVESRLGTHTSNFEEAFGCFDQAFVTFRALGHEEPAARAALCATECLDRLTQDVESWEDYRRALGRLGQYGSDQHGWVLKSSLSEQQRIRFARRLKAAYARALCRLYLHELNAPVRSDDEAEQEKPSRLERIIKKVFLETIVHLKAMCQVATTDPWQALGLGRAAWVQLLEVLAFMRGVLVQTVVQEEQFNRAEEKWRAVLRSHLHQEFLDAFLGALQAAAKDEHSARQQLEQSPTRLENEYLIASPYRLQEALFTFLSVIAECWQPLTATQLAALQEPLNRLEPSALPVRTQLKLTRHEPAMLGHASYDNRIPLEEAVGYFESRLRALNKALSDVTLSASERSLISSWISHLLTSLRRSTDDLAALEPARALALLDASGASAFRAETLFYGRGAPIPPPGYTSHHAEDMLDAFERTRDREKVQDEPPLEALMFADLHDALREVDIWGRRMMILHAGRESPLVREKFAPMMENAGHRMAVFPATASLELIQAMTGARPEDCEQRGDSIIVNMDIGRELPRSHEHVERARMRLLESFARLSARRLVPDGEEAPLATPERVAAWLETHPRCAIVVPGTFPECVIPMSVFFHSGGKVTRHWIGSRAETELREQAVTFGAFIELEKALGEDQREVSNADWSQLGAALERFSSGFTRWGRALSELLERHGLREVLFLLRGRDFVFVPWEEVRTEPGGPRLGERFTIGYLHTLAQLPEQVAHGAPRQGVLQLHGDGVSLEQMRVARSIQQELAAEGCGRPPISGREACDAGRLHRELRSASRVRLFLHGHHDQLNPESDRITLVDAERAQARVDLQAHEIRGLPVTGVECMELWACEGSAHGRDLGDHGVVEEPEDLSTALLLAGVRRVLASRWHVPALPSALLMERFALLLEQGHGEATALSLARTECRAAFEPEGLIERELRAHVEPQLTAQAADSTSVSDEQLRAVLEPELGKALQRLRGSWRARRSPGFKEPLPGLSHSMARLVRYTPSRPERLATELRTDPAASTGHIIRDWLQHFRNPTCWAGWRVVLRQLEDWRS